MRAKFLPSRSTPIDRRPKRLAAKAVVPLPMNGSKIVAGMTGASCEQVGSQPTVRDAVPLPVVKQEVVPTCPTALICLFSVSLPMPLG